MPELALDPASESSGAVSDLRKELARRDEEIARLRKALEALQREKQDISDKSMRDPATGFYIRPYFHKHLAGAVVFSRDLGGAGAVVAARLDGFGRMASELGIAAAEDFETRAAVFLRPFFPQDSPAFRYETGSFAWSLLGEGPQSAQRRAEEARVALADSEAFDGPVTASFAVLDIAEVTGRRGTPDEAADAALDIITRRLDSATQGGGNRVLATDELEELSGLPVVYIVDPDPWHASVLAERLESEGWEVQRFTNGASALEALVRRKPSIVVSELAVPQGDGFSIRSAMRSSSSLGDVPFVLLADIKDAASVRIAADLGIARYYKKPYFLSEIVSMLNQLVKRGNGDTT